MDFVPEIWVDLNSSLILKCKIEAFPFAKIKFERDEGVLKVFQMDKNLQSFEFELKNIQKSQNFSCEAENKIGTAEKTAKILIKRKFLSKF